MAMGKPMYCGSLRQAQEMLQFGIAMGPPLSVSMLIMVRQMWCLDQDFQLGDWLAHISLIMTMILTYCGMEATEALLCGILILERRHSGRSLLGCQQRLSRLLSGQMLL